MQTKIRDKNHLDYIIQQEMRSHGVYVDLNHLDVSSVTDMSYLFYGKKFKGNISKWDTSNVTQMNAMFWNSSFSGDISCWDTSNVQEMHDMFLNSAFDGDISRWDVSNVRRMDNMFRGSAFQGDISAWSPAPGLSAVHAFSEWNHSMLGLMGVLEGRYELPPEIPWAARIEELRVLPEGLGMGVEGAAQYIWGQLYPEFQKNTLHSETPSLPEHLFDDALHRGLNTSEHGMSS